MTKRYQRRHNKDFSDYSEARGNRTLAGIDAFIEEQRPTFKRMIVLDVISDPQQIDENKQDYWQNVLKVANVEYSADLPRNTVIAQPIIDGTTRVSKPLFVFPFFPSHLALPCKPGETIWCMIESPAAGIIKVAWWMCKIQGPSYADDVNHAHGPYASNPTFISGLSQRANDEDRPLYKMYNGKFLLDKENKPQFIARSQIIPSNNQDVFEQLITKTEASQLMQYEAVPRFKKRPGDLALEGSNNTLIVLGTDRIGPVAQYTGNFIPYGYPADRPPFTNFPIPSEGDYRNKAGSIDLVAGRGTTLKTGGTVATTQNIAGVEENADPDGFKKEIGKTEKESRPNEGDPDLKNDRSRVLIAQRTAVDTNFGLAEYQSKFNIQDTGANAAVVIKSDKVRIIARSDISLIVTNYDENLRYNPDKSQLSKSNPPDGAEFFYQDNDDTKKWASITIKRNGDIVFTPSEEGYIKLGADDADKPILCSDIPVNAEQQKGDVTRGGVSTVLKPNPGAATAIFTTGNKLVGTGAAGQGTFAKKVLVK